MRPKIFTVYNWNLELTHVKLQDCAMVEITASFTWEGMTFQMESSMIRYFNTDGIQRKMQL